MRKFSLVRLFLLVSFFVALFAAVLFIGNPAKHIALENNAKRLDDVLNIANATAEYINNRKDSVPLNISIEDQEIAGSGVNLCRFLVPDYLTTLPKDPSLNSQDASEPCSTSYSTGYHIVMNPDNSITISAPDTDIPPAQNPISVTRKIYKR